MIDHLTPEQDATLGTIVAGDAFRSRMWSQPCGEGKAYVTLVATTIPNVGMHVVVASLLCPEHGTNELLFATPAKTPEDALSKFSAIDAHLTHAIVEVGGTLLHDHTAPPVIEPSDLSDEGFERAVQNLINQLFKGA